MKRDDPKNVLAVNVRALMVKRYGVVHIGKFRRDTGIGAATVSRILEATTSIGIDILEKIAFTFKLEPWQLLVPDFDADSLPLVLSDDSDHQLRQVIKAIHAAQEHQHARALHDRRAADQSRHGSRANLKVISNNDKQK
jgi:transcriptional regulator with XRE-family HTH domain